MKRSFVRSVVLTFVLACGLQAIVAAPVLAETHRAPRPEPKKLWSTYPLDPRKQAPSPAKPEPSASVGSGTRGAAPTTSNAPQSSLRLTLVLVGLALIILAVCGAILVSFGLRPAWALSVAWRLPRPSLRVIGAWQPRRRVPRLGEGEPEVNSLVQRLLHTSGKRHRDDSEPVAASASTTSRSATRLDIFTPYSMRGRERNKTLHQAGDPTPKSGNNNEKVAADGEPAEVGAEKSYAQVGEEVTAVLASAQQAAEQIRESARQEVERFRAEAKDKVAAIVSETSLDAERRRREGEKVRADADVYSKETRGAADRYVAETRMKIDKEVAQRRAEVDEEVRGIRRAAERKARNLETEALQRQKALVQEVGRAEARLQQLLGIFRGMTLQLEGLVNAEAARRSEDAEEKTSVAEPLDEALRPRPLPSRSA